MTENQNLFSILKKSLKNYVNIGMKNKLSSNLSSNKISSFHNKKYLYYAISALVTSGIILYARCMNYQIFDLIFFFSSFFK